MPVHSAGHIQAVCLCLWPATLASHFPLGPIQAVAQGREEQPQRPDPVGSGHVCACSTPQHPHHLPCADAHRTVAPGPGRAVAAVLKDPEDRGQHQYGVL